MRDELTIAISVGIDTSRYEFYQLINNSITISREFVVVKLIVYTANYPVILLLGTIEINVKSRKSLE